MWLSLPVILVETRIQKKYWIPASAGMTTEDSMSFWWKPESSDLELHLQYTY
jgi:hypothetical protein